MVTTTLQILQFTNLESGEAVDIPVKPSMILGRGEPGVPVDIDLTPIGGYRLGISRQHLRVASNGDAITIEDLGSRNGTLLNGKRINPHTKYAIQNGDQLQLSRLSIQIGIQSN